MFRKISRLEARAKGLTTYFTGEPCKHGHIAKRRTAKSDCCECARLYVQAWTVKNKKHKLAVAAAYREANRTKIKNWHVINRRNLKIAAISFYGGKCTCCGETELDFLTIDHVNGGGRQHRKITQNQTYVWLKKNKYPTGFRVLCWNCNCAVGLFGTCPHQR